MANNTKCKRTFGLNFFFSYFKYSHEGGRHGANWTTGQVLAAVQTTDLMTARGSHAIDIGVKANDTFIFILPTIVRKRTSTGSANCSEIASFFT
jgi:hypothetical protein